MKKMLLFVVAASFLLSFSTFSQGLNSARYGWDWVVRRLEPWKQGESIRKMPSAPPAGPIRTLAYDSTRMRKELADSTQLDNPEAISIGRKTIRTGNQNDYEPMIAVSPFNQNNFVAVYAGIVASTSRPRASYTENNGVTWNTSDIPLSWSLYEAGGDPVVAFDRAGNAFYAYLDTKPPDPEPYHNAIVVGKSIDRGGSWTDQRIVVNYTAYRPGVLSDKPWIACDQSTSAFQNSVYVTWTRIYQDVSGFHYEIMFSKKRPTDPNFSTPVTISPTVTVPVIQQGSYVAVAPDGAIYVFWHKSNTDQNGRETDGSFWMIKSTDGGSSFGVATEITAFGTIQSVDQRVLGGLFQRGTTFPSVAIRPAGSSYELCVVWADYRNNKPEVLFSKSVNNGISWSSVYALNPFVVEEFLPAICSNNQGSIFISTYERISSSSNDIRLNVYESTDGSTNFSSMNDANSFSGQVVFTGDYMGIAANNHTYWAIWPGLVGNGGTIPYNNDIFASYKAVTATIRNDPTIPATTYIYYNGQQRQSPYPTDYEIAGSNQTIRASDPVTTPQNDVYTFQEWRDENNTFISNSQQTVIQIGSHTYTAKFSVTVSAQIKNEFKDPTGALSHGGIVNVNSQNINTDPLPNQEYATTFPKSGPSPRLEAIEQFRTPYGTQYWRALNPLSNQNGGWEYPDHITRQYTPVIFPQPPIQGGLYLAHFRNRYDVNLVTPNFIELGSSGATYKVNGTNVGSTWQGTFLQYSTTPIPLEAIAPYTEWVFLGWSDGDSTNPRQITPTDHVSLFASYKGHLKTSVPSFSDAKNQRRFVRANNRWMMVYESGGDIWLTESYDGVYWEREERLNVLHGVASNPTISNELSIGRFVVSWLEQNGGTTELHLQTLTLGYYLLTGNGHYYYGWDYSIGASAGERSSNNHRLVSSFYYVTVRNDARPVLDVETDGSVVRIQYAYEGASSGVYTAKIKLDDNYYTDLGAATVEQISGRNVSYNGSDKYPVIISYPAAFGYPAKSYVYYLGYGYASGTRVVQYDYWTGVRTLLPTAYDDYTFYSLQGAVNPTSASFALTAEVYKNSGSLGVNYYTKPTYYGSSTPSLATTYVKMCQPTIMLEPVSVFGSPTVEIDMRSTQEEEAWYKTTGSPTLQFLGSNIAGVFASQHVPQGDHATMVTRDNVAPAIIERLTGEQGDATAVDQAAVAFYSGDPTSNMAVLDFQGAEVEAVDSLQTGSTLSAMKILSPASGGQLVAQADSLAVPLHVDLMRDGTIIRSLPASRWARLNTRLLAQFRNGDVLRFRIPGRGSRSWGYQQASVRNGQMAKPANGEQTIAPPSLFALHANYPNPFNPSTQINFDLPEPSRVSLVVYDVLGRKVGELVNGSKEAGYHTATWNAEGIASGIYFARFTATDVSGNVRLSKVSKLLLAK